MKRIINLPLIWTMRIVFNLFFKDPKECILLSAVLFAFLFDHFDKPLPLLFGYIPLLMIQLLFAAAKPSKNIRSKDFFDTDFSEDEDLSDTYRSMGTSVESMVFDDDIAHASILGSYGDD